MCLRRCPGCKCLTEPALRDLERVVNEALVYERCREPLLAVIRTELL